MKRAITAAAFFCALGLGAAHGAPADLEKMRKAFSAALATKHIDAAVKMTRFPLAVVVYQSGPKMTEAKFRASISTLGLDDAGVQHCIANDPLTLIDAKSASDTRFANTWNADCNGNEYHFAQRGGAWLFVGYENINE